MSQVNPRRDGELETERLLRDFYRAELPTPWPAFQRPIATPSLKSYLGNRLQPSHIGLAASVLFLIGGLGAGVSLLRGDARAELDGGILPAAHKPAVPGRMFKNPPATLPEVAPLGPMPMDEDPPLSLNSLLRP
jgi:hypothetical protein